jgi:hypothetical protein
MINAYNIQVFKGTNHFGNTAIGSGIILKWCLRIVMRKYRKNLTGLG